MLIKEHKMTVKTSAITARHCRNTYTHPFYTRTVSEWTKDNTVSFGLRDMTRRFRYCLGR